MESDTNAAPDNPSHAAPADVAENAQRAANAYIRKPSIIAITAASARGIGAIFARAAPTAFATIKPPNRPAAVRDIREVGDRLTWLTT